MIMNASHIPLRPARLCLAASLAVATGCIGSAAASPVRELPDGSAFVVTDPAAAESAAARVVWGWREVGAAVETTPGWRLTSRVLVRAEPGTGREAIARMTRRLGTAAVRPARADGWYVVRAGSVDEAVRVATALAADPGIAEATVATRRPWALRSIPNDPLLANQWHLRNNDPAEALIDANVVSAWSQGITGAGVQIGIVEQGFSRTHEDLAPNFRDDLSQTPLGFTRHGTSVAGIAAARGNNGIGVAGAAYNAELAELFFGDAEQTAEGLLFGNDEIDVKNCSFGPADDATSHVADPIELDALQQAAEQGRGGLGTIVVWAAGNGGENNDRGDYDPYASSRYTISVNAIDDDDDAAEYAEPSSGVLITAHSSGNRRLGNTGITSTDRTDSYTNSFGGTSASAPLASGVIALMLEANPALTWRDVQHVLVESARINEPLDEGWTTNGAGRMVHDYHGFGALDAGAAVALAATWNTVAPAASVGAESDFAAVTIPDNDAAGVSRTVALDPGITIEHVELQLGIDSEWQGDLRVMLTSPSGTVSTFATPRFDDNGNNYSQRLFTSVRHWGEDSGGVWTVTIADEVDTFATQWSSLALVAHGAAAGAAGCSPADLTDAEGAGPDGQITVADFTAYLARWAAADLSADLTTTGNASGTPDGRIDLSDFSYYLTLWSAGCP